MQPSRFHTRISWIRKSIQFIKKITLPGFEGVPLYEVALFFIRQLAKPGLNQRAAAISFNFIMAIPPLCIFLFSLVPLLPIADQFNKELMHFVNDLTPNTDTRKIVQDFLDDFFGRPRNSLVSFGFLVAIFYSSSAVLGIIHSFNHTIHEKQNKGFLADRWKAIKLTVIILFLFIASMLILITQGELFNWLLKYFDINNWFIQVSIKVLRWFVIFGIFFYSIAFIYRHAPSVEKKWKLISPGSILACTLQILLTYLLSFWINNFAGYDKIYGSIGTIMILMILIYMNSLILLIGFELNVGVHKLKKESEKRIKEEKV
jgi:membrane protein